MFHFLRRTISFTFLFSGAVLAQVLNFPMGGDRLNTFVSLDAIQSGQMNFNLFTINTQNGGSLQSPSGSISRLDLKAPGKAQREYLKGYQSLMRKDYSTAVEHLGASIAIYPNYVAAHNALGTAYLDQQKNDQARDEFSKAVSLDDHLPSSSLNLGISQLALKDYPAAEKAFQKASSLAPLDMQLSLALAYGELANHDYPAVIETARQVHARKHKGAEEVHFFAAGAWQAQDHFAEAQQEMQTLLQESPNSTSTDQYRQVLELMKSEQAMRAEAKLHPQQPVVFSFNDPAKPTSDEASRQAQKILQDVREKNQIAEAEAMPDATCGECGTAAPSQPSAPSVGSASVSQQKIAGLGGPLFKSSVDEVAVFFAAIDHGKSVTNLNPSDLDLRDDSRPPDAILGFRSESELPLRLALVIDTSNSVTDRFGFEQEAATNFLQQVVTGKNDLVFVIGVNNSVLLAQDMTSDRTLATRAIGQLAPGGGTALWDAVAFAADKLAAHAESQPVARILVVISDGEDNSSTTPLKQAISAAQRGEVAVYTVSTRETSDLVGTLSTMTDTDLGDRALKTLSELTGGTTFRPGSARGLKGSLAALQQVIRSRYLISYKPASFERNGHYRTIDLTAQKDGHKLKVFARKGYYASVAQPAATDQ